MVKERQSRGFGVVPDVLSPRECDAIARRSTLRSRAGSRHLLSGAAVA
jgi:hypothetical protein